MYVCMNVCMNVCMYVTHTNIGPAQAGNGGNQSQDPFYLAASALSFCLNSHGMAACW